MVHCSLLILTGIGAPNLGRIIPDFGRFFNEKMKKGTRHKAREKDLPRSSLSSQRKMATKRRKKHEIIGRRGIFDRISIAKVGMLLRPG